VCMRAFVRAVCAPGREQSRARMRVGEADQRSDGAAAAGSGRARGTVGKEVGGVGSRGCPTRLGVSFAGWPTSWT
jgi:hypothetical protein